MTKLAADDVRKLARLSKLKLTEEEIAQFQKEMGAILEYVEQLDEVDTTNAEPTSQVTNLTDVVRSDTTIDYRVSPEELLKNAPAQQDGQFKVQRML